MESTGAAKKEGEENLFMNTRCKQTTIIQASSLPQSKNCHKIVTIAHHSLCECIWHATIEMLQSSHYLLTCKHKTERGYEFDNSKVTCWKYAIANFHNALDSILYNSMRWLLCGLRVLYTVPVQTTCSAESDKNSARGANRPPSYMCSFAFSLLCSSISLTPVVYIDFIALPSLIADDNVL